MSESKAVLRARVATTMHLLGEDPTPKTRAWWHYNFVLRDLGPEATEELLATAIGSRPETPTAPMWLEPDGEPRTQGGVFFTLASARMPRARWKKMRWLAGFCFGKSEAKRQKAPTERMAEAR